MDPKPHQTMNFRKKIQCFEKFPRFFKVYLLELSSERMKIPNAFIARIGLVLPEKVILRISPGRIWHVKVNKEENDVFFGMGWKEFAKHNSVEHGDFLVFKYNGGNVFDVKLFGKSECEKTERDEMEEILIEVEKDVEEVEEEGCDDENDHDYDDESDHDYDYNQGEEEGTEEEKVEVEEEVEVEDCDDHDYDYNEEEEDTEEDKVEVAEEEDNYEEKAKSSRKRRGKENIGEFKAHAGLKVGGSFRKNTTVKTEEIDEPEPEPEGFTYLRNPYFFTRVRIWLEHLLPVPKNWMRDNEIRLRGKVTYLGPQGRQWSGTVLEWTDGRVFIDGWADFCKANNIRLNDRCICELLPGQRGNVLRVRMVPI